MAAKKGLGKGLSALIPAKEVVEEVKNIKTAKADSMVDITKVEPNPNQPRRKFDEDALQELTDSVKQKGVIEPILVVDKNGHYMIVAGERRWRAAMNAGLKKVPVIVREYSDKEILEISIIENVQRENLNPIEEALSYKSLIEEFDMKQDQVAETVSKSRTAITNTMRLLKLSKKVQEMVMDNLISAGHARALLAVSGADKQLEIAERIMDERLSVREVEKIIKDLSKPKKEKFEKDEKLEAIYRNLEEKMKISLGTKVSINAKDANKGKIEIEYFSSEELERISDVLMEIKNTVE